jgi:integrase
MEDYRPKEHEVVFRRTKGKEPRTVPITDIWIDVVNAWLRVRPKNIDSPLLFVNEFGLALDVQNYGRTFTRYRMFAKLAHFTMHGIRHYSLTEIAKADMWAAMQIAGHKDARTTSIYLHSDPAHIRQAHKDAAPLARILVEKRQADKKRKRIV